jgi:hypothetical protein
MTDELERRLRILRAKQVERCRLSGFCQRLLIPLLSTLWMAVVVHRVEGGRTWARCSSALCRRPSRHWLREGRGARRRRCPALSVASRCPGERGCIRQRVGRV